MPSTPGNQPGSRQRIHALQAARRFAIRGRGLGISGLLPLQQFVERQIRLERLARAHTQPRFAERGFVMQRLNIGDGMGIGDDMMIDESEIAQAAAQEVMNEADGDDEMNADDDPGNGSFGLIGVLPKDLTIIVTHPAEENMISRPADPTTQHIQTSSGELQQLQTSSSEDMSIYLSPDNFSTSLYSSGSEPTTPGSFINYFPSFLDQQLSQPTAAAARTTSLVGTNTSRIEASTCVPAGAEIGEWYNLACLVLFSLIISEESLFSQDRRNHLMYAMIYDITLWAERQERETFCRRA